VSLRTDIRTAFDEVAPSTFGLPERVVQTVVRELPLRRRKEQWFVRLKWASGPVAGTDTLDGKLDQQRLELVLDMRHPPQNTLGRGNWTWGFTAGLAKGASGCTGWQIDTTGSTSERLVTRSIPG
jgi:hypothetical protein